MPKLDLEHEADSGFETLVDIPEDSLTASVLSDESGYCDCYDCDYNAPDNY